MQRRPGLCGLHRATLFGHMTDLPAGEMTIRQICETFGMSRRASSRAMQKADRASIEALAPKRPGRRPRAEEVKSQEIVARQEDLEKELAHGKQKYEVAKTFLELGRPRM